jgi:hypothetical protein
MRVPKIRYRGDDLRMTIAISLPATTEVLSDARDGGRALRVSWHPADDVCVFSIWREDRCAATFQLMRSDAPGLISCLVEGLAQPPSSWSTATYGVAPSRLSSLLDRVAVARRNIASRLIRGV